LLLLVRKILVGCHQAAVVTDFMVDCYFFLVVVVAGGGDGAQKFRRRRRRQQHQQQQTGGTFVVAVQIGPRIWA
jgi:hypothetical protein